MNYSTSIFLIRSPWNITYKGFFILPCRHFTQVFGAIRTNATRASKGRRFKNHFVTVENTVPINSESSVGRRAVARAVVSAERFEVRCTAQYGTFSIFVGGPYGMPPTVVASVSRDPDSLEGEQDAVTWM